jgi:hypothetical protein
MPWLLPALFAQPQVKSNRKIGAGQIATAAFPGFFDSPVRPIVKRWWLSLWRNKALELYNVQGIL